MSVFLTHKYLQVAMYSTQLSLSTIPLIFSPSSSTTSPLLLSHHSVFEENNGQKPNGVRFRGVPLYMYMYIQHTQHSYARVYQ